MTLKERMKKEAVRRLKELKLYEPALEEYENEDRLYLSERTPYGGILYWADQYPEVMDMVKDIETKYKDYLVYHVLHDGSGYSFLVVSKYYKECPELENRHDSYGFNAFAVVPYEQGLYDLGDICIKNFGGGLIRTY